MNHESKKCPKCDTELNVVLFMGVQPDFYSCSKCRVAFSLEDLRPLATIIGSEPTESEEPLSS